MINLIVRLIIKFFGSFLRKQKHYLRKKFIFLYPKCKPYSYYRQKHSFSDFQIIIYFSGLILTAIGLIAITYFFGIKFLNKYMLYILIAPFILIMYFQLLESYVNVRKLDLLKKKRLRLIEEIKSIYVSDLFNEVNVSNYNIVQLEEFKISRFYDWEHEARLRAIDYNCNSVINTKIVDGYFIGYLAKTK